MSHTEQQASHLWCPMARAAVASGNTIAHGQSVCNRIEDAHTRQIGWPAASRCIAGQCAMWRWTASASAAPKRFTICDDAIATDEPPRPAHVPASWTFEPHNSAEGEPAGWLESDADHQARRTGHCGLAVRPD